MSETRERWRVGLLGTVLVVSAVGYGWMYLRADTLRPSLLLLTGVFVLGTGLAWWWNRRTLEPNVLAASVALGAVHRASK